MNQNPRQGIHWAVSDEGVKFIFDFVKNLLSAVAIFIAGLWMLKQGSFRDLYGMAWLFGGCTFIFVSDFLFAILSTNTWNRFSKKGASFAGAMGVGLIVVTFATLMVEYSVTRH